MDSKKGVLLVNLGTPVTPERKAVGQFLNEFLADPRVVDLPRWLWLPLLRLVIVPLRSERSAKAYRKIWGKEGSPLLVLTNSLAQALQARLGEGYHVMSSMRYGQPSIESALKILRDQGLAELTVIPLFPQFSLTTTASVEDELAAALARVAWNPAVRLIRDYHQRPSWVAAMAASIAAFRSEHGEAEMLLFSLHGIPQRYVSKGDPYQAHCEAGVQAIADVLGLDDSEWLLTYQSRVGRDPWLQPYTDKTLIGLPAQGVRRVQVVCPGFAVDCLETLEEIAMQNKEFFIDAGGETLEYIPALNDSPAHVEVMLDLVQ